jgi:hypothetical protein
MMLALTPTKVVLMGSAMFAILFGAAIMRIPAPAAQAETSRERVDAAWANDFQMAVLRKTDRLASITAPEPTPKHPDIAVEPPALMPPVVMVEEERDAPPPRRRVKHASTQVTRAALRGDVCTRHHMRKVTTRGGRSWRCRK